MYVRMYVRIYVRTYVCMYVVALRQLSAVQNVVALRQLSAVQNVVALPQLSAYVLLCVSYLSISAIRMTFNGRPQFVKSCL